MGRLHELKAKLGPGFFDRLPNWKQAQQVPVRAADSLSLSEFQAEHLEPGIPVVLRGAVTDWPAAEKWVDPEYLVERAGHSMIAVKELCDLAALTGRRVALGEYLQQLAGSDSIYMGPAANALPNALGEDIRPFPFYPRRKLKTTLWFVGRGSFTGCHQHDGSGDAVMCQVLGGKSVCLYPPDLRNDRALYAGRRYANWSAVDVFDVDLKEFPRFAKSTPWAARVEQGDALFIPDYWWHAVASLGNSYGITVTPFYRAEGFDVLSPPVLRHLVHSVVRPVAGRVRHARRSLRRTLKR